MRERKSERQREREREIGTEKGNKTKIQCDRSHAEGEGAGSILTQHYEY